VLIRTYRLATAGLFIPMCARSMPKYDRFSWKTSIASEPFPMRSRLPTSTMQPNSATHCQLACRSSPDREFKTTSTPLPFVATSTSRWKVMLRELKMCSRGMLNSRMRYWTLSSFPTVQKI
jgi:hypothetical protein